MGVSALMHMLLSILSVADAPAHRRYAFPCVFLLLYGTLVLQFFVSKSDSDSGIINCKLILRSSKGFAC